MAVIVHPLKYPNRIHKRTGMSRASEIRTFGLIATCVMTVSGVGICLVTSSSQTDLSDLTPVAQPAGSTPVLSWASLLRDHRLVADAGEAPHAGMEIRALGYAMDPVGPLQDVDRVRAFVLLPDAGNLMHPAHRFGDQMVVARQRQGDTYRVSYRRTGLGTRDPPVPIGRLGGVNAVIRFGTGARRAGRPFRHRAFLSIGADPLPGVTTSRVAACRAPCAC